MTKNVYTLGRSESCDICVTRNELKPKWLSVMSKVHFRITREFIDGSTNDAVVYLEDLSQNGTFINKEKVGRGKKVVLESNDVISLAQPIVTGKYICYFLYNILIYLLTVQLLIIFVLVYNSLCIHEHNSI